MSGDLHARLRGECPRLEESDYVETSPKRRRANCFGWAVGDDARPWYPKGDPDLSYWPPGASDEFTVQAFVSAFATEGFAPCADGSLTAGTEKVALYVDDQGQPSHAALQLSDGRWISKMGTWEDITHATTGCLEGGTYGRVTQYLARRRAP